MTSSKPSASKPASLRQGKYRLHFETQAWQEWKALDGAPKKALRDALIKRLDNPHVPGSALKGELSGCYKIKLLKAGYRLVYEVLDDVVVVLVLAVDKREDSAAYITAATRAKGGERDTLVNALRSSKIRGLAQSVKSAYTGAKQADEFVNKQRDEWKKQPKRCTCPLNPLPMIDLDKLNEAKLIDLNHHVVARLKFLQQMRARAQTTHLLRT